MSNSGFRSWSSFADSDEAGLETTWKRTIVQLALLQHGEVAKTTDGPAPEFDDAVSVFDEAIAKKLLPWWPDKLERVTIRIRVTPVGQTTETLSPMPVDPNTKDLGKTMFINAIVNQLDGQGDFDGAIQIQILRATDKSIIGQVKQEVLIGTKAKKKKGGGSGSDDHDDQLDELRERDKRQMDMVERMFNNSAHTLGAAASVVQATRGVNPAPPWMQDGADGAPLWFNLLNGAMQIGGAMLSGQDPKKQIQKIMSEPTHPMLDGGPPSGGGGGRQHSPPQLTDRGSGDEGATFGTDQFLEEGQYDGFHVVEADLLDDGFDDEEEFEYSRSEYEDDDEDDDEEDEEEDEEEDRRKKKRSRKKKKESSNPLDEMDPNEVGKLVEQWVDKNIGKHRGEIQGFGMRLAGKIMKG